MRLENRGGRSFVLGVLRFDNDNKMRPKADLVNVCLTVSQCCLEYSRTLTPLTVFEKVYKIFELRVAKKVSKLSRTPSQVQAKVMLPYKAVYTLTPAY